MLKRRTEENAVTQHKLRSVMHLVKKSRPVSSPVHRRTRRSIHHDVKARASPHILVEASSVFGASVVLNHATASSLPHSQQQLLSRTTSSSSSTLFPDSTSSSLVHSSQHPIRLRNQLYKEIGNFVTEKQVNGVISELMEKRETLSLEMQELLEERRGIHQKLCHKNPSDSATLIQQDQEIENRLEIIEAEVKYISARIKTAQMDLPDAVTDSNGQDNAMELLTSLDPLESRNLLEMVVGDLIGLKLEERSRAIQLEERTRECEGLRRSLKVMHQAALKSTLESEQKIVAYELSLRKQQQTQRVVGGQEENFILSESSTPPSPSHHQPNSTSLSMLKRLSSFPANHHALDASDHFTPSTKTRQNTVGAAIPFPNTLSSSSSHHHQPPLATRFMNVESLRRPRSSSELSSAKFSPPLLNPHHNHLPPIMPSAASSTTAKSVSSIPPSFKNSLTKTNIFERLHREQTVASQAKMRDHVTVSASTLTSTSLVHSSSCSSLQEHLNVDEGEEQLPPPHSFNGLSLPHTVRQKSLDSTSTASLGPSPHALEALETLDSSITPSSPRTTRLQSLRDAISRAMYRPKTPISSSSDST